MGGVCGVGGCGVDGDGVGVVVFGGVDGGWFCLC